MFVRFRKMLYRQGVEIQKRLMDRMVKHTYAGIKIVGLNDDSRDSEVLFFRLVTKALQCIEQYDPRRFRALLRETDYIANRPGIFPACYHRSLRSISIDFSRYAWRDRFLPGQEQEHEEWYVALIASILIHEMTHGYLFTRGIPYNEQNYLRVERICHTEQCRFARKLPTTRYRFQRSLVPPFDPSGWVKMNLFNPKAYRKAMFARLRLSYQRFRKSRQTGRTVLVK